MGAWGVQPTDSDDFADAWADLINQANKIAKRLLRNRFEDAYAGVGVVVSMADANIPIDEENYDKAVETTQRLSDDDEWLDRWRDPRKIREALKGMKAKLSRLRSKGATGPGYGLMGGHARAIR